MSGKRTPWINRRGQEGAASAIDQVLDRQPQPGEQIQQLPDLQIEDSPYQARQTIDKEGVAELAQGMRESGFQGVLVARPHSDPVRRRQGVVQLIYGHRRRLAWRQVCAERGVVCTLPVVIRPYTDAQLLTIGAQENLQRQDLDPIEEAQLVAWHEDMFYPKSQTEIAAMLGKSVDWVKTRARIHRLPDPLKARLRARPRAISQVLELGSLYTTDPTAAMELADRVIGENLTLDTVRTLVRGYTRPAIVASPDREISREQCGTTLVDPSVTNDALSPSPSAQTAPSSPPTPSPLESSPAPSANRLHHTQMRIDRELVTVRGIVQGWQDIADQSSDEQAIVLAALQRLQEEIAALLLQMHSPDI